MKNRTRILTIVLSILMIVLITPMIVALFSVTASAAQSGDFKYTVADGNATITEYVGSGGDIVIPSSLEGYTVTAVADGAFISCSNIVSLTVPSTILEFGDKHDSMFAPKTKIKNVHISDLSAWCNIKFSFVFSNPLTYAENLYLNGERIVDLVIPNDVEEIEQYAFLGYRALNSVTIPPNVKKIGTDAFGDCTELGMVEISDLKAWCDISFDSSQSNPLFYAGYLYLNGEKLDQIDIPDGITSVGQYTFINAINIIGVRFPDTVTEIKHFAFSRCSRLQVIEFSKNLKRLDNMCFSECTQLYSVDLPEGVEEIAWGVFSGCSILSKVAIPNSVSIIGQDAFRACGNLKSITLPDSVTQIHGGAFAFTGLIEITIPSSVKEIGEATFYACTELKSITLPDKLTKIKKGAFQHCVSLEKIDIPDSVNTVGEYAFERCICFTSVTLPSHLRIIGKYAFKECPDLKTVTFSNRIITFDELTLRDSGVENIIFIGNSSEWESFSSQNPYFANMNVKITCRNDEHSFDDDSAIDCVDCDYTRPAPETLGPQDTVPTETKSPDDNNDAEKGTAVAWWWLIIVGAVCFGGGATLAFYGKKRID